MNTPSTKLIAILSIVAVGLAASTALAKDKGNGNGNGGNNNNNNNNKKSAISIGIGIGLGGGSNKNFDKNSPCHDGHCYDNYTTKKVYVPIYTCYRPLHCFAWVLPGDTWTTLSLREYGNPNLFPSIAAFNGLSLGLPLVVGQQIRLPEIHPSGVLKVSFAPAPAPFVLPLQTAAPIVTQTLPIGATQNFLGGSAAIGQQAPVGLPNASAVGPATSGGVTSAMTSNKLPSFAVGSVIGLNGQSLGGVAGTARLKFAGVALKVDVIEWTDGSVKIHLPEVDLAAAMQAELEVVRADGTLAMKTGLELTPAANKLAQGN